MSCISWMKSVAFAALLTHAAAPLWAAEPLTLAQALAIATDRSQQLVAQGFVSRAARELAVSAGQWPDPVLKLGLDNLPASGSDKFSVARDFMTMRRIGLVQEITRSDKRQLKTERFERDAERAQAQRQLVFAGLQRDTALAWLEVYYAQAMRLVLLQLNEETRLQSQAAETAFQTGRGSQADVFAARAATLMLEDRLSQVDRQSRSARLMLARWIGTDATRPLAGQPAWQTSTIASMLSTDHLKRHPQLVLMAALLEAAQTDARLAQANTKSDWTLEAAYQQRGPSFSNMLSIGVSIPLQLDPENRQNRDVGAKLALVEEAKANYQDLLRAHELEVYGLINDWQNGKERVMRYTTQLLPIAKQRTEAALTAYRMGKNDLATALAARRDELDTRLQSLTLELETARLWAQLNYLAPDNAHADMQISPVSAKDKP